jgi:hypothetical protein
VQAPYAILCLFSVGPILKISWDGGVRVEE